MEATYAQTSFLGGEISKWAQGDFKRPEYAISLAKAQNILLVDEGAAPRRPGFMWNGATRLGKPAKIYPFDFSETSPYNMEFTDNFLRFWNGNSLVTTNDSLIVSTVSNANPAVFTLPQQVGWKTGDQCYFTFTNPAEAVAANALLNRQFTLTMISTTSFSLTDSITGAPVSGLTLNSSTVPSGAFTFDGPFSAGPLSDISISGSPNQRQITTTLSMTVNHVEALATPYSVAGADWHSVRTVQGFDIAMLLHGDVQPQALEVFEPPNTTTFAEFTFNPAAFQDGPYLDPPANAVATVNGTSGNIQVVVGYAAWVNTTVYGIGVPVTYNGQDFISLQNANVGNTPATGSQFWQAQFPGSMINSGDGFQSTDVGRMFRFFSAPLAWNSGTTYSAGQNVAFNGSYFTSLISSNTNNQPDISLNDWVISTTAAIWTWGTITSVLSQNTITVQIQGGNLLYTTPCPLFRVGAWSNTTGWPTCGCYQNGRFWFGGAIANRVDSTESNSNFGMAPTLPDGTVEDASAISYTMNSNSVDLILDMQPQPQGIMVMTAKGEYLLNSGTSGGPITPTSITDSPATKYGCANVLAVKTGLTMCFVQKYSRRLLEYLADVFSQRFFGPDLTTYARHIAKKQFQELAYQQEPAPVVWARMGDGSLAGVTYRRNTLFSNQKAEFVAWHQHPLGSQRLVESICVGPSVQPDNILDTLAMVTNDPATNIRYVETMTPLLDESDPLTSAWYLDTATTPQGALLQNGAVTFYGLNYLNGRTASVFAAGLDCGDFFVENGQITVPLGTVDQTTGYAFDIPQFQLLQPMVSTFTNSCTIVAPNTTYVIPCVIGMNYQTKGQLCRPMKQEDTGARTGPALGKLRKTARYAINMVASLGVKVGADHRNPVSVPVTSPGGKQPPYLSTFSGIKRESLPDDYTFDSMLYWQTTRPFPATITAFGGFIDTQDS